MKWGYLTQHALRLQIPIQRDPSKNSELSGQLSIYMGRLLNLCEVAAEHLGIESESSVDMQEKYIIFQKLHHNQLEEAVKVHLQTSSTSFEVCECCGLNQAS